MKPGPAPAAKAKPFVDSISAPEYNLRVAPSVSPGSDRVIALTEVIVRDNESFEAALRRFTRKVQQYGILSEARRREHFEKPSVRRKRKAAAKRRKSSRSG
jgi:small subunit ribosomal protein S21